MLFAVNILVTKDTCQGKFQALYRVHFGFKSKPISSQQECYEALACSPDSWLKGCSFVEWIETIFAFSF